MNQSTYSKSGDTDPATHLAHTDHDMTSTNTIPGIYFDPHDTEGNTGGSGPGWAWPTGDPIDDSQTLLSPFGASSYARSMGSLASLSPSDADYFDPTTQGGEEAEPATNKKVGKRKGPGLLETVILDTDDKKTIRKKQKRLAQRVYNSRKARDLEILKAQVTALGEENAGLKTALASTKASVEGMTNICSAVASGGSVQITSESPGSWPLTVHDLRMTVPGEYGSRRVYDAEVSEVVEGTELGSGASTGFDLASL